MGIDPGSQRTGWGVVEEKSGRLTLVDCGVICAVFTKNVSFSTRLGYIYKELCAKINDLKPEEAAIEQVFTAKNPQSALKLGQARGVAVAACAAFNLRIYDYEPTLVKQSIVGNGRATKDQVSYMVNTLLNQNNREWALDTSDSLAVAICHLNHLRYNAAIRKGMESQ